MTKTIENKLLEIMETIDVSRYETLKMQELKDIYKQKRRLYHVCQKAYLSIYSAKDIEKNNSLKRMQENYENREALDANYNKTCAVFRSKKSLINAIAAIDGTSKSLIYVRYLHKYILPRKK